MGIKSINANNNVPVKVFRVSPSTERPGLRTFVEFVRSNIQPT